MIGSIRVQALGLDGYLCDALVVSSWDEDGAEGQRRADLVADALQDALDADVPNVRGTVGAILTRTGTDVVDVVVAAKLLDALGVTP